MTVKALNSYRYINMFSKRPHTEIRDLRIDELTRDGRDQGNCGTDESRNLVYS